jgi:hypothetical protein
MFDYTFKLIDGDRTATITYQNVLKKLDIENEVVEGQKLSEGGVPQAMFVKTLFEKVMETVKVEVYFDGRLIL